MAYNTNTRLLLKFNEANYATTSVDSSQTPKAVSFIGTCSVSSDVQLFSSNVAIFGAPADDPSEAPGSVSVDAPDSVFSTSTSSAKRIDLSFQVGAWPTGGAWTCPFEISADELGYYIHLFTNAFGEVVIELQSPTEYWWVAATLPANDIGAWHHLRMFFQGHEFRVGIDGAEVGSLSSSADTWVRPDGVPIDYIGVGSSANQAAYLRGYVDNFHLLEGDTSWTGGSYTVPTAAPDGYVAGPAPISGTGANTVVSVVGGGSGQVGTFVSGVGANTTAVVTSQGSGIVQNVRTGSGANTVSVSSSGIGTAPPFIYGAGVGAASVSSTGSGSIGNGVFTTLLLHGNASDTPDWKDSSIYGRTVSATNVSTNTTTQKLGDGALSFNGASSSLSIPISDTIFGGGDKLFDTFVNFGNDTGAQYLFEAHSFPSYWDIALRFDLTSALLTLVIDTPDFAGSVTAACNGYDGWHHIRAAFIGSTVFLCVDGIQLGTATTGTSAPMWPTLQPATFRVGSDRFGGSSLLGSLDEFRLQEGSVVNHGYSGGNFSVPAYEYVPNMVLGAGANAVGNIGSSGSGFALVRVGSGGNTAGVSSIGYGFAGSPSSGANTVDNVLSVGTGYILPIVYGVGGSQTVSVFNSGNGGLVTYGRGANVCNVTSHGAGGNYFVERVGAGANTLGNVLSIGNGVIEVPPERTGAGENAASVSSVGTGNVRTFGRGENSVSSMSQGAGVTGRRGAGENTVSLTGAGIGTVRVSGIGANTVTTQSYGFSLRDIFGTGSNTVSVGTLLPPPSPGAIYCTVLTKPYPNVLVRTRTPSVAVRR